MNELEPRYEVTKKDLAQGARMKIAAWTAPFALSFIPFFLFLILFFSVRFVSADCRDIFLSRRDFGDYRVCHRFNLFGNFRL